MLGCEHPRIFPDVFDQTLGVTCPDCNLMAWCWAEKHVPEDLWNLACKNDDMFVASDNNENRHDYCAICSEVIP